MRSIGGAPQPPLPRRLRIGAREVQKTSKSTAAAFLVSSECSAVGQEMARALQHRQQPQQRRAFPSDAETLEDRPREKSHKEPSAAVPAFLLSAAEALDKSHVFLTSGGDADTDQAMK